MCTHLRYIYNRYSRQSVIVPCGKCPACLQSKASARSTRIRNNVSDGTITLFATLTYSNDYVPYIRKSDLSSSDLDVSVYRDSSVRYVYSRYSGFKTKVSKDVDILTSTYVPSYLRSDSMVRSLPSLRNGSKDKVGVCLNSDFQKFIKRLSIDLKRNLSYKNEIKYSYFYCSELGSVTKRPHFHALFFIPKDAEAIFRSAIVKNWPYGDSNRTEKYLEIARDAASYVSSYVNSNFSLPETLQVPMFKPKHNYSKNFGLVLDCFNLRSLLAQVDRGTLYYHRSQKFDGNTSLTDVPIPLYVINRYFPKHKGFCRLTTSDLQRVLLAPGRIREVLPKIENPLYSYSDKEIHRIVVNLNNCYDYFHKVTGLSRLDYARYYVDIYALHHSITLRDSYKDVEDFSDFYFNANDYVNGLVRADTLAQYQDFVLNPNCVSSVVDSSAKMTDLFYKLDKQKKVTNYCMANNGHNV